MLGVLQKQTLGQTPLDGAEPEDDNEEEAKVRLIHITRMKNTDANIDVPGGLPVRSGSRDMAAEVGLVRC